MPNRHEKGAVMLEAGESCLELSERMELELEWLESEECAFTFMMKDIRICLLLMEQSSGKGEIQCNQKEEELSNRCKWAGSRNEGIGFR
jgi:hypothetical protein